MSRQSRLYWVHITVLLRFKASKEKIRYKKLAAKQLSICQKNQDAIVQKANKLYQTIYSPGVSLQLVRRCCDFKKLEEVLAKRSVQEDG